MDQTVSGSEYGADRHRAPHGLRLPKRGHVIAAGHVPLQFHVVGSGDHRGEIFVDIFAAHDLDRTDGKFLRALAFRKKIDVLGYT